MQRAFWYTGLASGGLAAFVSLLARRPEAPRVPAPRALPAGPSR